MLFEDVLHAAQFLLDAIEHDENDGGLLSRETLRKAGELRRSVLAVVAILSDPERAGPQLLAVEGEPCRPLPSPIAAPLSE